MSEKSPLGIKPRFLVAEERLFDIDEAIERFLHSRTAIPVEWIEERNELIAYLKEREER